MKNANQISGVVIAKNEEKIVASCIKSLLLVCDEVILVDSFSTDATVAIAEEHGATVYQKDWQGYAETKNYANQLAKHDFILSLDADESLSTELIQSIRAIQLKSNCVYEMNRLNQFNGTWMKYGGWYPDRKVRLFHKKNVEWRGGFVHEVLHILDGIKMIHLNGDILHNTADTPESFEAKNLKYAKLRAEEVLNNNGKLTYIGCWLSAITDWLKRIVLKQGWRDGKNGFKIARINAGLKIKRYHFLKELKKTVPKV